MKLQVVYVSNLAEKCGGVKVEARRSMLTGMKV